MTRQGQFILRFCVVVLLATSPAIAQGPIEVGIEERLGEVLPLETFTFADEDGNPIVLKDLFDRPVVLTLVYLRCPSTCTPLLQELSRNVDNCDLTPGEDYRMVTISFDPTEKPDLAKLKKTNFLATLDKKEMSPNDWRWLTGDEETIKRITEQVGFHYIKDKNKVDYVHAATVIFLSSEGKIVRYLNGVQFNPADLKMAVIDATQGRARSFMRKVQALCYTYDPASRGYVLQLNRIILAITVIFVMGFGGFLLLKKSRRSEPASPHGGDTE
ncbi:MAG: SCO family protein [Planctomycetota bacterium]